MQVSMTRYAALWLSITLMCASLYGQKVDFNDYKPAVCSGDLPVALRNSTTALVQANLKKIKEKKLDRKSRQQELEHSIRVGFVEEELLTGGQILYGEAMSDYVEQVGMEVLKSYPDLKEQLQFYVLRSHVPNAYTTSGGLVFVSIGLLARIENEAQLAVILAHEIQHYVKKHSLQTYKDQEAAKRESRGDELDEKLKNLYRFSKEQELEADDLGYEMISKTNYNLSEGIYGFEVLKYSAYPFLETPYSLDSLESTYYKFPKELKERIDKSIETAELENKKADEKELLNVNRTHPQLDLRILALKDRLNRNPSKGDALYIVGKESFDEMQKIARHELLLLFLRRADHGRTLYLSRVFELLYGHTPFVSRVKAMSIYALMHHKLAGNDLDKFGCDISSNRGMWRPLTAGLKSLDPKELSVLGMRIVWQELQKFPEDVFLIQIWEQSLQIIQKKALVDIKALLNFERPVLNDTTKMVEIKIEAVKEPSNLLSRPNRRTETPTAIRVDAYYAGALTELPNQSALKTSIEKSALDYNDWVQQRDARKNIAATTEIEKVRYLRNNRDYKGLVLLQPRLNQYDGKNFSENVRNYFAEEKSKSLITDIWKQVVKTSGDNVHIIENKAQKGLKTKNINQYTQVNDWIMERLNNDTNEMILFYSQYVSNVMQDFGTPLVAWTGYEYSLYRRPLDINGLMTSLMFFPYLPVYLYFQLQTDGFTKQFTVVFNTESSKLVFTYERNRKVKFQEDYLKAHVYETLYEIRHAKQLK